MIHKRPKQRPLPDNQPFLVDITGIYLPNRSQRPAFHPTPKQSRKIVLRPVNTKDFGVLGVGTGAELRFNLWPSLQPRNCYFGETTKM